MQFLNKAASQKSRLSKKSLAYLTALTLLFSYAEMILPRPFPFFRLGLANTVILLALDINLSSFILLSILKAIAASLMGGTLFTPFFFISLIQSLLSALVMRLLHKLISKRAVSLYGISVAGSALSALLQLGLASLYLGSATFALLGPMLIFNSVSGIITAFFCESFDLKKYLALADLAEEGEALEAEVPEKTVAGEDGPSQKNTSAFLQIFLALILLVICAGLFFIKNQLVLACALILSLLAQRLCKRKIFILPHLSLWLFIFITALFMPNGRVLYKLGFISITQGAMGLALGKALTLSAVSALSQCAVCLKPGKNSLLGLCLEYYKVMSDRFRESSGSIFKRIAFALKIDFSSGALSQSGKDKELQ